MKEQKDKISRILCHAFVMKSAIKEGILNKKLLGAASDSRKFFELRFKIKRDAVTILLPLKFFYS